MKTYFAPLAYLADGWKADVRISVDDQGSIVGIESRPMQSGDDRLRGPVLPGMPNLHSHAFQRAMAGLTEVALNPEDSFWTWRDLMYRLVGQLTPEQVETIATYLYIEMLKGGYTSVAEFHYLHHDQDGRLYANPAEMSHRVRSAARTAGIGQTLLPVLYSYGGFGAQPASEKQGRFLHDVDAYLRLIENAASTGDWGLCFHSLRAVTPDQMKEVIAAKGGDRPIHIHIAEQQKEVDDCLAWSGKRPIDWLYDHFEVDERWCLIHATHATDGEVDRMAASRAVVGICPTTEANLGDGIFPAVRLIEQGGHFGIGSDSHVSTGPLEEIRWLEYGQRLKHERRNRLATSNQQDVGEFLFKQCLEGGRMALGQPIGAIETGKRADLVVLDGNHPMLSSLKPDQVLGRWLFGGSDTWVRDVMVAGQWRIKDRHHDQEEEAGGAFASTMKSLLA